MNETNTAAPTDVQLYSIGHSDHDMEAFLDLLRRHDIAVVVDVRSQPYSQWVPQFNRENLARDLEAAGLRYVFMGDSLGGRPADRALYEPGQEYPDYDLVARSEAFRAGIEQLLDWSATERLAIMCSEGDYRKCHRHRLITPALLKRGARVVHIRPDGTDIEAQPEPEQLTLL